MAATVFFFRRLPIGDEKWFLNSNLRVAADVRRRKLSKRAERPPRYLGGYEFRNHFEALGPALVTIFRLAHGDYHDHQPIDGRQGPSSTASWLGAFLRNLFIPKGLRQSAQGCDEGATLGQRPEFSSTLQGLRQRRFVCDLRRDGRNPVGVENPVRAHPRVARSAQPWAE